MKFGALSITKLSYNQLLKDIYLIKSGRWKDVDNQK